MTRNPLVFIVLGAGLSAASAFLMLQMFGDGAVATGWALDATARVSFAFWFLTFIARPLNAVKRSEGSKKLVSLRRQFGIAFASAHIVHAYFIVQIAALVPADFPPARFVPGGFVYLLILLMFATSFDRTAKVMPGRSWQYLHRTGQWVIALAFLNSSLQGIFIPDHNRLTHMVLAALVIAAIGLRAYVWQGQRKRRQAA
ncbi:hypothetical protein [Gimibacter soli]|uniref:DMSO/TMAO reductase YedYZ heme-binding membrane subunit n=1 Tax=Gimibacter soli TaxID=3024400 RepID=A0AAF0BMJ3_9PROT|nr:hypothetical protein [Gimibacter soli]WCL54586.1 hypothetical protein PH603_02290 [Gimibacter soli]